jgi:hypothetical protein
MGLAATLVVLVLAVAVAVLANWQERRQRPVGNPPRILAAPINYRAHEAEAKDPGISQGNDWSSEGYASPIDKFGLFLKSPTSVVGAGEGIELAFPGRRSDFEIELAVGNPYRRSQAPQHGRHAVAHTRDVGYGGRHPLASSQRYSSSSSSYSYSYSSYVSYRSS